MKTNLTTTASTKSLPPLARLLEQRGWLTAEDGIIRCPLLRRGSPVEPPRLAPKTVRGAFTSDDQDYARVGDAQILRHRVVDRETMRLTDRWLYQVMPVIDPTTLIENEPETLAATLYAITFDDVLDWCRAIRRTLEVEEEAVARVRELDRLTSGHPDAFVDAAYDTLELLLEDEAAERVVDEELGRPGVPGRKLLDGWVDLGVDRHPGPVHAIGIELLPEGEEPAPPQLRAMPTRQLHITAGNSPLVPLMSLLRAVWTKSAAVVKLPHGATLPGSLVGLAAAAAAPDHPLTKHMSLVYWRGGDEEMERVLLAPGAFDRIVVWGAPGSVGSVKQRALLTKTVCFNPRYSVSYVGREAFADDGALERAARLGAADTMVQNQKACIASLVHYVEGSVEDSERYAETLRGVLAEWDAIVPHPLTPRHRGQLKRLSRGVLADARFHENGRGAEHRSAVVVAPSSFPIQDHPMCRLVVVRPVDSLASCSSLLHHGVATVGVYPESRRIALRDAIAARGVSNVVPLGGSGAGAPGMAHDGMRVLSELVDWKNG